MNLISLTLARNSAWCIEATIGHALNYCDSAVVLCHACTDGTQEILRSAFGKRVDLIEVAEADRWNEMRHRQATLRRGRELGGTHFMILDDDEVVADPLVPQMREFADRFAPGQVALMPMVCCWRDLDHYRCDRDNNPFARLGKSTFFTDSPTLSWKPRSGYHHHHTHPFGSTPVRFNPGRCRWMHLQHASWPRLVVKQTWYMAAELLRYGEVKADYRRTMSEIGVERREVPADWWAPGLKSKIDLESEPWQLRDLRRMIDERGVDFFRVHDIPIDMALSYWT